MHELGQGLIAGETDLKRKGRMAGRLLKPLYEPVVTTHRHTLAKTLLV